MQITFSSSKDKVQVDFICPSFTQITEPAFCPDKPQPEGHVARREPVTTHAEVPDGR